MSSFAEYTKKKKKKQSAEGMSFTDYTKQVLGKEDIEAPIDNDIAPVKETSTKKTDKRKWFEKGAFEDGYQFGDLTKTILGSTTDAVGNAGSGILGMGEKIWDFFVSAEANEMNRSLENTNNLFKTLGIDKAVYSEKQIKEQQTAISKFATDYVAKDLYDEEKIAKKIITEPVKNITGIDAETDSIFGEKADALAQSAGQLAATATLQSFGVPWWLTTGATTYGAEAENALREGATLEEANASAFISAGAEILTEKLSGGISFGGKTLDDVLTKELSRGISNKVVRTLAKLGIDAVGEGGEEILSGVMSAIGQKLTYADDKEISELFSSEEAFESFIGGFVLGGGSGGINVFKSNKKGVDYASGLKNNEKAVVDKVYENTIAEREADGKKLTQREKSKIYDDILNQMEDGEISTDTIEEILGGETYKTYKSTLDIEEALQKEFDTLNQMKQGEMTGEQIDRRAELKEQLADLKKNSNKDNLKTQLNDEVFNLVKDTKLVESYNEKSRRGQAFEADLSQYEEKYHGTIKKAVESGILNNTRRTHKFVDMIAKISADKGVLFDFTDNERIANSSFAVEGKTVNGYVNENGNIVLNINSAKALNTTAGHEITHILEGTELYDTLASTITEYAKSKGDYQGRIEALNKLYEGVYKGEDFADKVNKELVADLVGDYVFTDKDFIRKLSVENRNIFEKIYDEIKYLCKVATAGSKEARELERVKKVFAEVYRESGQVKKSGKPQTDTAKTIEEASTDTANETVETRTKKGYSGNDGFEYFNSLDEETSRLHNTISINGITITLQNASQGLGGKHLVYSKVVKDGEVVPWSTNEQFDSFEEAKEYAAMLSFEAESYNGGITPMEKFWGKTAETDTKYSLSADSEGTKLSKGQQDFFKDSKMRDDNGNLKVMYHGSEYAGFHEFNNRFSDDDTSFFFVDRNDVAQSYSGSSEVYTARSFNTVEEFNKFFEEIDAEEFEVIKQGEKYALLENGDVELTSPTLKGLYDEFCDYTGLGQGQANYKVYLNLTNPLEVDAEGRNWNRLTSEFSQEVYDRIKSLTDEEKTALTQLAAWEDSSIFRDELQTAVESVERNANYVDNYIRTLASAAEKLGDTDMYRLFDIATDNFTEESLKENAVKYLNTREYAQRAKEQGYDGVIFKNIVDNGGFADGSEGASTVAIAFNSNQIKSVANDKPTSDPDIRYSLSEEDIDTQINQSMTMDEAKQMVQRAFVLGDIQEWYDGEYKNGDEWLRAQGADEVAMYIDNEYTLQEKYLNKIQGILDDKFYTSDVLEAYLNGTLTGKEKPKAKRLDTSKDYRINDERFYSPQRITEAKNLFEIANQRITNQNRAEVSRARAKILLFAHNKGASELLGLSQAELNKKLRAWGGYPASAVEVSKRINNGVADSNRWSGIENCSWLNVSTITDEEIKSLVKSVEGESDSYENKYIARTMLALDTHIDWSWLSIEFDTNAGVNKKHNGSGRVNGFYRNDGRKIVVSHNMPNTVAHEMGHALDYQWARDLGFSYDALTTVYRNTEKIADADTKQFFDNFKIFMDSLTDNSDIRSEYTQDPKEVFARFVAKFIQWVDNTGTGGRTYNTEFSYYNDNFSASNYIEFAKLLQEKSMLDAKKMAMENGAYSLSEQGETVTKQSGLTYGKDIRLEQDIAPTQETVAEDTLPDFFAPTTEEEANEMARESLESLNDADVPIEVEDNYYNMPDTTSLDDKTLKNIGKALRETLYLTPQETKAIQEIVQEYSTSEFPNNEELFNAIKEQFGEKEWKERNEEIADVKRWLRTTKIKVSDTIKNDIADYSYFRKSLGSKLKISKDGTPVDIYYKELVGEFPNFFSEDMANPTDLFLRICDVANMDIYQYQSYPLDDETIQEAVNIVTNEVSGYKENLNRTAAEETAKEDLDDIAPVKAEQIIEGAPYKNNFAKEPIKTVEVRQAKKLQNLETELANNQQLQRESIANFDKEIERLTQEYVAKKDKNTQVANNIIRRVLRLQRSKANVEADYSKRINDLETRIDDLKQNVKTDRRANILVDEPKVEKPKSSIWAKFKTNFLDKQSVFEKLSLETKNRELQAKANFMRYSEGRAQNFIGKGEKGVEALNDIRKEVENAGLTEQLYNYLYHKHNVDRMTLADRYEDVENKPVFGDYVTAEVSQQEIAKLEKSNPEIKNYAERIYNINKHLRNMLVEGGVISQETANLWEEMYPHYVPVRRVGESGLNINVALDTNKTGINAPVKRATGGNSDILPLFDTMAQRALQTYKAVAKNSFGVELKNTLGTTIEKTSTNIDEVIDSVDNHEELLQEGKNGQSPTFTVFENGERVTFEITEEMYDALKPTGKGLAYRNKFLKGMSNIQRGLLTEYNPVFMLTNAVKDVQDVLINSQHAVRTYANFPKAISEMMSKGKWYTEYMQNGGEQNTYFDNDTNTFAEERKGIKKIVGMPLDIISGANNIIERLPRLAEYIASRKAGRSVEVSMLDAARVTTNFAAGGDVSKFLNANGCTFLNASIQGAVQQARNVQEAKANGLKGWVGLATKFALAGLPAMMLNGLLWDDDEEYEELSDYVKDNYYIIAKYGDGQFVRVPKGRALAVIQKAIEQVKNAATGEDEVDLASFLELAVSNLAPNNPLDNNILAPILQVANNETWYGEDLVPTRLQDLPEAEQYDESTDAISKWLGEKLNYSPYKINYLLNQYSGGVGDVLLPMLTPEAESGDNSLSGNLIAPLKDKFTTNSVMNNQNVSDFYDTVDELTANANSIKATDEDILKSKYMNSISSEIGKLYGEKREIQNSNLPDNEKYSQVKNIQEQINAFAKESLNAYGNVSINGDYATVGDLHYRWYEPSENSDAEAGWQKISDKQLEKQEEVTSGLGISASEYWSNKAEYDYAYENPENYAVAKAVGGYDAYKSYTSELYDIKADKDKNGKSISGSRKEKVIEYINNLDADYGERIILFKSQYNADDTYNYDIIDYLNNREDISYEEMVTILKELGFTVDGNGNIYWD